MIVKWKWIFAVVFCVLWSEGTAELKEILKAVDACFCSDVEFCLSKHVLMAMQEVSGMSKLKLFDGFLELRRISNGTDEIITPQDIDKTFEGRSLSDRHRGMETLILDSIWKFIKTHTMVLRFPEDARGQGMLRTYRRFRRFFVPLLIGVKLKLAAFLPFTLSILGLMSQSAFLSGNAALFLSGLTIFLRYFYPKLDAPTNYHYGKETAGQDGHSGAGADYSHGHYHQPYHHHHPHHHHHQQHHQHS